MIETSEEVAIDEYGMIEVRTRRKRIDFPAGTWDDLEVFFQELREKLDHATMVAGQLDFIERDIVDFWTGQGLPAAVCHGRHPAADAGKASELGLSWTTWRHVQDARRAIATSNPNLAFLVAWIMGRIDGERHQARRHGRNACAGRNSKAAIPRTHSRRREQAEEIWAERLPVIDAIERGVAPGVKGSRRWQRVAELYENRAGERLQVSAAEKRLRAYRRNCGRLAQTSAQ